MKYDVISADCHIDLIWLPGNPTLPPSWWLIALKILLPRKAIGRPSRYQAEHLGNVG
jgi:hypothetical protein